MGTSSLGFSLIKNNSVVPFITWIENKHPGDGDNWATRWPGIGQDLSNVVGTTISPVVSIDTQPGNINKTIRLVEMGISLANYSFIPVTSATFNFQVNHTTTLFYNNLFGNDPTYDSIGLTSQRETVRGTTPQSNDYFDLYDGVVNGTEYGSNRVPLAGIAEATNYSIAFNAAGISYLNSVWTKADLPTYAFFTLAFGGNIDGLTPDLTYLNQLSGDYVGFTSHSLTVDFDNGGTSQTIALDPVGTGAFINVVGGQINISNSWKVVNEVKINIGATWKDIV